MLKKHIILLETEKNVWVAYSLSDGEANKMTKAFLPGLNYYVFECDLLQQYPYTMKLKYPLNSNYRVGMICTYREEEFVENEECLVVTYRDFDDEDTALTVELFNHHFEIINR